MAWGDLKLARLRDVLARWAFSQGPTTSTPIWPTELQHDERTAWERLAAARALPKSIACHRGGDRRASRARSAATSARCRRLGNRTPRRPRAGRRRSWPRPPLTVRTRWHASPLRARASRRRPRRFASRHGRCGGRYEESSWRRCIRDGVRQASAQSSPNRSVGRSESLASLRLTAASR